MLNANALRASMVENNCSVRELAEICGLKPKAFYQRLNGVKVHPYHTHAFPRFLH